MGGIFYLSMYKEFFCRNEREGQFELALCTRVALSNKSCDQGGLSVIVLMPRNQAWALFLSSLDKNR